MLYYMFTINHAILYCILHIYCYKAIEEIYGENPRDTTVFWGKEPSRSLFSKKQKIFLVWSRRVCVPNLRSVPFSVWSGGSVQANIYTSELKKTHSSFVMWILINTWSLKFYASLIELRGFHSLKSALDGWWVSTVREIWGLCWEMRYTVAWCWPSWYLHKRGFD